MTERSPRFAAHAGAAFLAATLVLAPLAAFAFGSSDDSDAGSSSGNAAVDQLIDDAEDHIDDDEYREAIPLLDQALQQEPENADVLNYLGYSHRKLGEFDMALDYYNRALAIEPAHLGANEYLGELYLQLDQLDKAQERLQVLADACNRDCEEFEELEEAIAEYREAHGQS